MSDLIDRQAAIDALVKAIREDPCYDSNEAINGLGVCDVRVILNDLPSAQPTQEIIHCKDCRFWKKYKYFNGKPTYAPFCGFNSIFTDDNDFCSRAEKRGEADG